MHIEKCLSFGVFVRAIISRVRVLLSALADGVHINKENADILGNKWTALIRGRRNTSHKIFTGSEKKLFDTTLFRHIRKHRCKRGQRAYALAIRYSPNERQNIVNSTVFLRQIVFCLFQNFFYQNKTTVSSPTSNVDCWRNYVQNNIPQHNKFIFLGIKSYGNNLGVFLFQNKVNHQSNALLITSLLNV